LRFLLSVPISFVCSAGHKKLRACENLDARAATKRHKMAQNFYYFIPRLYNSERPPYGFADWCEITKIRTRAQEKNQPRCGRSLPKNRRVQPLLGEKLIILSIRTLSIIFIE
jgi:hypothetical protein